MLKIKRAVLIGDIGGHDTFHVGDEAMLEANLGLLHRLASGVSITAVSGDPAYTKLTYGVDAVSGIGFPSDSPNRIAEQARIDQLVDRAIGGAGQIPDAFVALLESDLLMVSGGGNFSSSWPGHILERLALVRLARKRGIPIIVLGQTLGPNLEPEDRLLVAEILEAALWVGLREAPSVALAIELGISLDKIDYQLDDAIFLTGSSIETMWPRASDGAEFPCVIALTLHPFVAPDADDPLLDQLAGELDRIIEEAGAHILFLPHVRLFRDGADSGDRVMGEAVARRLVHREAMTVLDVQGTRETVWLTQRADMVLSSRYHPLIFGLAAGKPCLALPTDEYTQIKLRGAMIHADLGCNIFPIDHFSVSGLADKALEIFVSRQEIQPQLERKVARWRYAELDREKRLSMVLRGQRSDTGNGAGNSEISLALATTLTLRRGDGLGEWEKRNLVHVMEHWRTTAEETMKYAHSLEDERASLTNERNLLLEQLKK